MRFLGFLAKNMNIFPKGFTSKKKKTNKKKERIQESLFSDMIKCIPFVQHLETNHEYV